ncbi:clavesin-2-like [Argiope bruennichi]|uniref:Clavesin-1 like protein n=1 Tax=Argiope bruennichi TaxID=94029 RepID=A0A8T0EWP2_ARGBR|nr:clavesin-2-like [Argiope bruennichi]KAF8778459.1 Clavesin-1 like protein [Argiope bruennichi]
MSNSHGLLAIERTKDLLPLDIKYVPELFLKNIQKVPNEISKNALQELKECLKGRKESKAVEFENDFLNVFLQRNNYNVKEAFRMILCYLDLRKKHSYLYQRIEIDFTTIPSGQYAALLPHRHPDGSAILLYELGKWNPDELSFEDFKRISRLICYQELRNPVTQVTGFRIIHDFANTGYQHLKYCTPMNMYLLYHASFECVPGKYLQVHFINTNFVLTTLLTCSKPFMIESIRKMLYFHSSVEELFEYFPRSALPVKYGGTLRDYYMADYMKKANEDQGDFPAGGLKNLF